LFEIGTGSLIDVKSTKIGTIPRISVQTTENGIIGYFDEATTNARYFENFISVNFFGISYYHPYRASVEMKVHTLKYKDRDFTEAEGHFISAMINKRFDGLFSYGSQLSSSKLKNENYLIQLPTKNSQIDFEFMENFIAELEAERISELEAYLVATGLKDYTLTEAEKQVLADFKSGKVEFGEFKIGRLFEIESSKKRFDANKVTISEIGKPYVVRTALNNGIRGCINEDEHFLNQENTISFGQDTATMFYQPNPYFTGDKIKIVSSKDNKLNKLNAQFFISMMTKSFSSFSWGGSSFNIQIIGNQTVKLPTRNNQPDYEIMDILIRAIQKLVIKDVVQYVDKKIVDTKSLVNK
jgi:Type I restriction modification DNA specificity domain